MTNNNFELLATKIRKGEIPQHEVTDLFKDIPGLYKYFKKKYDLREMSKQYIITLGYLDK